MNVEAINVQNSSQLQMERAPRQVSEARKQKEDAVQSDVAETKQVQPEELLQQIKSLTEDGLYSVHFERDDRSNGMVVKIVDRESDEVIRQVPAEELLELKAVLEDLRGNIINTEG
jgi:flagellar protein FlaG